MTELNTAVNYEKLGEFLRTVSVSTDCNTQFPITSRETLKIVCDLASSEKDKRLIKYAVSCGGNMSREAAKKKYGISDLTLLKNTVENAIEQAREIRDAVDHLSNVKEDCILVVMIPKVTVTKVNQVTMKQVKMAVTQAAPMTWIVKTMVRIPMFHPTAVP